MRILVNERLSEHRVKTPEGYLICIDAILARTGKQTYRHNEIFKDSDDESEIEIDRPEVEVFSDKTLASFENKPITDEHPDEDVNVNNYKQHSIGFVRDIRRAKDGDQDVMIGNLVITDKDAIEEIESGERTELSCGYDCEIVDDNGQYIQKNIRGNHVALCEQGRAGNARIIDSENVNDAQMHTYEICYIDYSEVCIAIVAKSEQDAIRKFRRDYGYYTIVHVKQKDSVNDSAKFYVVICENNDVYIAESIDRAKRLANAHDGDVYEVDGNIEFYRQTLKKFGQRAAYDEWWNDRRKGKARLVDARIDEKSLDNCLDLLDKNGIDWSDANYETGIVWFDNEETAKKAQALLQRKHYSSKVGSFTNRRGHKSIYIEFTDSIKDARYEYYIIESAGGQHLSEGGRLTMNPNDYREVEDRDEAERLARLYSQKLGVQLYVKKDFYIDSVNDAVRYAVEFSYTGDGRSDFLTRVWVNAASSSEALRKAEKYAKSKYEDAYGFKIVSNAYSNSDVIDSVNDAVMHGQIWFVPGEKVWMLESVSKSGKYSYKTFNSKEDAVRYAKSNNIVAEIDDEETIKTKDAASYKGKRISWDRKAIYGRILSENDPLTNKTTIELDHGKVMFISTNILEKAIQSGEAKIRDALVEPDTDDLKGLEKIFEQNGFKVESLKKNLFGGYHYQIRSTQAYPKEKFKETVVQIVRKIDTYADKIKSPITWNFGHMNDGSITAGVDVREKYVKDSMKEFIVKHNDRKFKVSATSPKDAAKKVAKLNNVVK